MRISLVLLALVVNSGSSSPTPALLLTMYSDAQCPCSAQFVSDVKHFLDNAPFNTSKYQLDFQQYFVPKCMDAIDSCGKEDPASEYLQCIHGDEECLGHRYFLCAQAQAQAQAQAAPLPPPPRGQQQQQQQRRQQRELRPDHGIDQGALGQQQIGAPTYRQDSRWLDFQYCSYGRCQECDVFTELFCLTPCSTYTTFTKPTKNRIMEQCAAKLDLDYTAMVACAATGSAAGDALQIASAAVCKARNATYGTKGLPVITVGGPTDPHPTLVRTKQAIPLFCGPTPLEVLSVVCSTFVAIGLQPPPQCRTTKGLCSLVQNATRLPECKDNQ